MARKRLEWPLVHVEGDAFPECPHCGAVDEDVRLTDAAKTYRPKTAGMETFQAIQYGVGKCSKCGIEWTYRREWLKDEEELELDRLNAVNE